MGHSRCGSAYFPGRRQIYVLMSGLPLARGGSPSKLVSPILHNRRIIPGVPEAAEGKTLRSRIKAWGNLDNVYTWHVIFFTA